MPSTGFPDWAKKKIDTAFEEVLGKSYGECVQGCKDTYGSCNPPGSALCKGNLESCLEGCAGKPSPDQIKKLMGLLTAIEKEVTK